MISSLIISSPAGTEREKLVADGEKALTLVLRLLMASLKKRWQALGVAPFMQSLRSYLSSTSQGIVAG